jgi:hypothetical protein
MMTKEYRWRTAWHILDSLLPPAHAEHCALHGLNVQVLLLARNEVGAHDAHLGASSHLPQNNPTHQQRNDGGQFVSTKKGRASSEATETCQILGHSQMP